MFFIFENEICVSICLRKTKIEIKPHLLLWNATTLYKKLQLYFLSMALNASSLQQSQQSTPRKQDWL